MKSTLQYPYVSPAAKVGKQMKHFLLICASAVGLLTGVPEVVGVCLLLAYPL